MDADPARRLLDFIRVDLGLTGTKEGCGIGECGACTVILNREAVHACLSVAGQLDGGELLTIEGMEKNGEMDRIQKTFLRHSTIQCGFCASGMVMSVKALLMKNPTPTEAEVKRAIAGNLCRCTGYKEVKAAVREISEENRKIEIGAGEAAVASAAPGGQGNVRKEASV